MQIEIINQQRKFPLRVKKIKTKAERILRLLGLKDKTLGIVLTSDRCIRKLNRRYLGRDRATDVLAFSMMEGKRIGDRNLLGDVVISLDTAARAARCFRRTFEEELYLYLVHGILHLIGYRDTTSRQRNVMEKLQGKILKSII